MLEQTCPRCWGDGYIDHDAFRETCGEVGTGAGEGATGQDTGTAWVTRSTDCPEAPAQAHLPATPPAPTTDPRADTVRGALSVEES